MIEWTMTQNARKRAYQSCRTCAANVNKATIERALTILCRGIYIFSLISHKFSNRITERKLSFGLHVHVSKNIGGTERNDTSATALSHAKWNVWKRMRNIRTHTHEHTYHRKRMESTEHETKISNKLVKRQSDTRIMRIYRIFITDTYTRTLCDILGTDICFPIFLSSLSLKLHNSWYNSILFYGCSDGEQSMLFALFYWIVWPNVLF